MDSIPYYYIWTPNYKLLSTILQWGLSQYSFLEEKSIFMEQSVFDTKMYKSPEHFLRGCFIKLEKTLELLETLPENSYFLFSDADILIFPERNLKGVIDLYISSNTDIVFMREAPDQDVSNIGFSLLKVCEQNRELFRNALTLSKEQPTNLDQTLVNEALKQYRGTHTYFPVEYVMTSSTIIWHTNNKKPINQLMVFQPLCDPREGKESIQQQKLSQYKILGFPLEHFR